MISLMSRNGTARDLQKSNRRGERLIAFGWYGGKFSHLDWLLPLLPPAQHYCEPFAGSAAVLINRKPSPIETYNDVTEYAISLYEKTGGIEFVVLDCIGFIRHYLHLFHRLRQDFIDWYQEFVLMEP